MNSLENQENIVNDTTEVSDKKVEPTDSMQDTTEVVANTDMPENKEGGDSLEKNKSYVGYTREELVNELQELLKKTEGAVITDIKGSVESIKQAFYRLHKDKENLLQSEGDEGTVVERVADSVEETFRQLLGKYKEMKASANALLTEEKEKNLKLKEEILAKLEELTNSTDDLSTTIPAFRKLQQEWKAIGQVPQKAVNEIWKTYNKYQEKFYDLIKINNELREYDFKKNLELKNTLCLAAEKLEEEPNAVLAFNTLQKLHEEWREIGPVAKEEREAIWNRFKEASSKINKKHQAYFESLKEKEEENLRQKTAICEKAEAIDLESLKNRKGWQDKLDEILALQEEWKKIGFATKKANTKIYKRFRAACDSFFKARNIFYKALKEEMAENLDRRKALLEKAEALKTSDDWKAATEKIKELQKEWRSIGVTFKKHSDEVWEKFSAACDYIFEQREQIFSDQKATEEENLKQKRAIIDKVSEFSPTGNKEADIATLKEFMAEFDKVGFVPRKDKAAVQNEFRSLVDSKFDIVFNRQPQNYNENKKAIDESSNKYLKEYNMLKKEIASYENNILFLNSSSKKGNSLVDEMNNKISELKAKLSELSKKI